MTGERWLSGDADLIPELEYIEGFQKSGHSKLEKFVKLGNDIGVPIKELIPKIGSVVTDAANNYAGLKKGFQGILKNNQKRLLGSDTMTNITCLNHGLMNLAKDLKKNVPLFNESAAFIIKIRSFFSLSAKRVSLYEHWCAEVEQPFLLIPQEFEIRFYKHYGGAVKKFTESLSALVTFFSEYLKNHEEDESSEEKETRASDIVEIFKSRWDIPVFLLRIRHLTELDTVLDKKLEKHELLCDEVRELCLEHIERLSKASQSDFSVHEEAFEVQSIERKLVNNRSKYYVKCGKHEFHIKNFTRARSEAKRGIREVMRYYQQRFNTRMPVLDL